jgi:hypothetical protein
MMSEKSGRNRSEGWSHAKKTGHENETAYGKIIASNHAQLNDVVLSKYDSIPDGEYDIEVDGNKKVPSIFDDKTTSKVDIEVFWPSGERMGVSLKKSSGGQAWLVTVPRFFAAVEHYTNSKIEEEVRTGVSLFIGGANVDSYEDMFIDALKIDKKANPIMAIQEARQRRLMATSLQKNLPKIWDKTIDFFNENISLITELTFSKGASLNDADCADVVVYNKITKTKNFFPIPELVKKAEEKVKISPVVAGTRNGGSTLILPTGNMQMHRPSGDNQMQFRHEYARISLL